VLGVAVVCCIASGSGITNAGITNSSGLARAFCPAGSPRIAPRLSFGAARCPRTTS
jgi:hypothetical protein